MNLVSEGAGVAVATAWSLGAHAAAAELARQLAPHDLAGLVVFVSPDYDAATFAAEMARRFGATPVVGCTTAGEITPDGWSDGAVVAIGFLRQHFAFIARPILDLANFHVEAGRELTKQLRAELSAARPGFAGRGLFGLLLVDGLCRREEAVVTAVQMALDEIPLVGGSAGDGLRFERTFVIHGGRAYTDAAVLALAATDLPFKTFRADNFEPTGVKMVVTEADVEKRIVKELNAEPAAKEYARVCGILDDTLDAFAFASHPVVVTIGGQHFVRSIQRVNPDGSLSFFCAIDEGLVFTAARRRDPFEGLATLFGGIEEELGEVDLYLGFDCVLRRLAAEREQIAQPMSKLYRAKRVVGFNTYGEQYTSMHVNQTFTGVAIGRKRTAAP
ncbi:FIST N-terminal domain-containing protein [Roseiarcus fermentans]|uniref:FIST N-terminal domain-containing protein n=1 Tax=Roseiarcus fermentans TaxID=1473586 RepID=UPI001FE226D6|nr:FIST N-terminal domain-containing protein [Roseiarcus fermentans]